MKDFERLPDAPKLPPCEHVWFASWRKGGPHSVCDKCWEEVPGYDLARQYNPEPAKK